MVHLLHRLYGVDAPGYGHWTYGPCGVLIEYYGQCAQTITPNVIVHSRLKTCFTIILPSRHYELTSLLDSCIFILKFNLALNLALCLRNVSMLLYLIIAQY